LTILHYSTIVLTFFFVNYLANEGLLKYKKISNANYIKKQTHLKLFTHSQSQQIPFANQIDRQNCCYCAKMWV